MAKEDLSPSEIEALLNEFDVKLKRLRTIYEQYFLGIERMPPTTLRKEIVRLMHRLESLYIRNTGQKFRLRSMVQRFNTYKSYWMRVERQIEEGTYKRDINRAKRRQERRERMEREQEDEVFELDLDDADVDLVELQAELEELDLAGAFDKAPAAASKQADTAAARQHDEAEKERIKQARLREIQAQLGLSGGAPAPGADEVQQRRSKLDEMRQRFAERTGSASKLPTGGASADTLRKLSQAKERLEGRRVVQRSGAPTSSATPSSGGSTPASRSAGSPRTIERSGARPTASRPTSSSNGGSGGDGYSKQVYEKLLEAKRRCNESTQGLSYETVSKSMAKQREQLQRQRGARDVEFKVVIKDGRAFLKPVPK